MTGYVFIQRAGDLEKVKTHVAEFLEFTHSELVSRYNSMVTCGIVGSHEQAIQIVALNIVFKKVFSRSPIVIEDNILVRLTDKITLDDNQWKYVSN